MIAENLGLQAIEERRGVADAYLSASRLNCWLVCPLRWKLRYVNGLRTPTTPAMFLGKVCHCGLEDFYRHRQLGIALEAGEVTQRLLDSWGRLVDEEQATFDDAATERALQKQACDLVAAYLAQVPADEPKPLAVEVALEAPLVDPESGDDLGMPLVGIVDLILDGHDGPVIADFKTSARSSEPMEITHEIQLSSYAYLFRRVEQRQEAGLEIRSLIKTKVPKIEFHAYPARTDGHFRRLFAVVREYLAALDAGHFNYRPGFGCGMCEFRQGLCRQWTA